MTTEHEGAMKRIIEASRPNWHYLVLNKAQWVKFCEDAPMIAAETRRIHGVELEPTKCIPEGFAVALDIVRNVVAVVDFRSTEQKYQEIRKEADAFAAGLIEAEGPAMARMEFQRVMADWRIMSFVGLSEILDKLATFKPLNAAEIELQRPIIAKHMQLMPAEDRSGSEVAAIEDEAPAVERVARPKRAWE